MLKQLAFRKSSTLGRGFALVEALVTVLVFAIGMLGVIGLQTLSLASNSLSTFRNEANVLASDMTERMRANRGQALGVVGIGYDNPAPADNSCRAVYAGSVKATPVACTPAQLAADDLFDWQAQVAQVLPGGQGIVCIDSTPDDGSSAAPACDGIASSRAYAVKVFWNQRAARGVDAGEVLYATMVRP
jgi:type IV pilus assembly protein PilV